MKMFYGIILFVISSGCYAVVGDLCFPGGRFPEGNSGAAKGFTNVIWDKAGLQFQVNLRKVTYIQTNYFFINFTII